MALKSSVEMPSSKVKREVARVLTEEGYLAGFEVSQDGAKAVLRVGLKYHDGKAVIDQIQRVSRPGLRIYKSVTDIPKVLGGLGVAIVSTDQGVMTDRAARAKGVGGEVLCVVS
jgi:small subunit ribosomal protein S8